MLNNKIIYLLKCLIGILLLCFFSCSPKTSNSASVKTDSIGPLKINKKFALSKDDSIAGLKIYELKCVICHQPDGNGITGLFPPLAGSDYLLNDKLRALRNIRQGFKDSVTVNGEIYKKYKMPLPELTSQQLVDVMNYILNSWDNNGGLISIHDIESIKP